MKNIIVANWKCNPTSQKEARDLFLGYKKIKSKKEIVVCPPVCFLETARGALGGKSGFALGAQDCFWENKGAFTGHVSPLMLQSMGVQYVILGHSEKRALGETNGAINKKLKAALGVGLKPILCLGETEQEKQSGGAFKAVENMLFDSLKGIAKKDIVKIILAYEPVWAIGSKKPCSPDEALTMALFLRKIINSRYSKVASRLIAVLYGGSVQGSNAQSYLASQWISGLLVGSIALDPKDFATTTQLT